MTDLPIPTLILEDLRLPNYEYGKVLFEFFIACVAHYNGVACDPDNKDYQDYEARIVQGLAYASWPTNSRYSTYARVIQLVIKGDFAEAGRFFKDHLLVEKNKEAEVRSNIGKKGGEADNPKDGLNLTIAEYFEQVVSTSDATTKAEIEKVINDITKAELLETIEALEGHMALIDAIEDAEERLLLEKNIVGGKHIDEVKDGIVYWRNHDLNGLPTNGGRTKTSIKNLDTRLNRAKKEYIKDLYLQ